jgi:hypothetical protein
MDDFARQLKNDLQSNIYEFNNKPELADVRQLYKNNFDRVVYFIERSSPKLAVKDIAGLNSMLAKQILSNTLFLKEINKAIAQNQLTLDTIK